MTKVRGYVTNICDERGMVRATGYCFDKPSAAGMPDKEWQRNRSNDDACRNFIAFACIPEVVPSIDIWKARGVVHDVIRAFGWSMQTTAIGYEDQTDE